VVEAKKEKEEEETKASKTTPAAAPAPKTDDATNKAVPIFETTKNAPRESTVLTTE